MATARMHKQRTVKRENQRWHRQKQISRGGNPNESGGGTVPATGATAGTPGSFTPAGSTPPANLGGMPGITASPATAWTTGQHVVLGDASHAHWTSAVWAAGDAT